MTHPLDRSLDALAKALRRREISAVELLDEAVTRHETRRPALEAYLRWDPASARADARRADERLSREDDPSPFCGLPISVKDLYGMDGVPVFAGTVRPLPSRWSTDAWLVRVLRRQGAVFTGRTHTVELAYGAVGTNPHHGTPRHPRDDRVHRVPGGSSSGAAATLVEGSAVVALGSDTGGSIRIPASLSGTVGQRTSWGRWPTDGVVPLSPTLDTVGGLTRTVDDAAWFFGAVDPAWGDPAAFRASLEGSPGAVRLGVPRGGIRDRLQDDVRAALDGAVARLGGIPGWTVVATDGALLDEAERLYMEGGIISAECRTFLEAELPEWIPLLDPRVAARIEQADSLDGPTYRADRERLDGLRARAPSLFETVDVLLLPGHLVTPPPLSTLRDLETYLALNRTLLRPTCPVSLLGFCALTLPVGRDDAGLPVGLQLVAPAGADERLLGVALEVERALAGSRG